MSDIYKAPEAELAGEGGTSDSGSLEKGIAGDYSFSIGEAISEGWQLSKGKKRTVWFAIILYVIAIAAISFVAGLLTGYPAFDPVEAGNASLSSTIIYNLITAIVGVPLVVGMMMVGIKIARKEETSGTEVFAHFDKIVPLCVTYIIMSILMGIGFLLLVIPGIYLAVAYMMALPLVIDQNLGPWKALEASRKAITKNWFAFLGFFIVLLLIYIAGGLALLIGLIWAIPLASIAYGVAYRKVFGGPQGA
ncbi:hypothetical protein P3339_01285 [Microbulbifer sp. MLAF003]|uniref:hypothetical protein n=1 Tax=Microbulbifer sp. MLAF003 TaxID=3032582 RepID=UPI0024ACD240|nr:hypothetical protein [Microbulbifer sp. MLAF003]WHI51497.1 hypothetical protein P3339_01285 [Microbulbifer sp. MLAF003]